MYQKSMVTRTGLNKFQALSGAFAVKIAREKKDPLYEKLIRFKKAYRLIKQQIMNKYGTKAKLAARAAASK
jgi:hypothetical protein